MIQPCSSSSLVTVFPHRHGQIPSCTNVKGVQPLLWGKIGVPEVQKCLGNQQWVKWELSS